ncbi:MAG: hypothetical protein GC136_00860 [Alphaproteobacteria bacterium]|nr:hypothetical protein [Alphaproteobacteria bacterium]
MASLITLAEQFVISKLAQETAPVAPNMGASQIIIVLAGFLGAVGIGFFILASYLWLNANYSPQMAAALTGLVSVGIAGLLALGALAVMQYKVRMLKRMKNDINETIDIALKSLNHLLEEPTTQNPKTSALVASLAGFVTADKILH